ncbi:MAG: hypothetical protein AYK18_00380 [Theionarchaea archaeon DG-70]|nr:MAG: hypothetical protein AYK18_00380 [Theionarchaea archaeon DG-70]
MGRTVCFVNTAIPKIVNGAMSRYESTGITQDLKRIQMTNRWNPVLEDYRIASRGFSWYVLTIS